MSDLFSSSSSSSGDNQQLNSSDVKEIQEMVQQGRLSLQITQVAHELNDICWDKCVDRPASKMDSKTSQCMENCTNMYLEVMNFVTNRYAAILERNIKN